MKKTIYTCDFCVKDKQEKELRTINGCDICQGCNDAILSEIFENPLRFPQLKLTPFCNKCKGRKYITEKELGIYRIEKVEYPCPECFKLQ